MSTYTKVSAKAINTKEKMFIVIEYRATVFWFDYLNMFPIDGP
jgi:hypothetical protein